MYYQNNSNLKQFSRNLRKNQTDAEKLLWSRLKNKNLKGYKFYRQFAVDNYILDFYCPDKKLAIELDGSQHILQKSYDDRRTNKLKKLGINVLRFWDNDVLENVNTILEVILVSLESANMIRTPPAPSSQEGGKDKLCMPYLSARTRICLIIGDPIDHSLSPAIHNAGYKALGIEDQYIYLGANVKIENIAEAVLGIRALNIRGVSCTMPHKLEVIKYLDKVDPIAFKIGAVNTIVNEHGCLTGYNTDWLGVITPLEQRTKLTGKKAAVIGAGGAARAIIYGLKVKKADITIYNRTLEKAELLAREFDVRAESFIHSSSFVNTDIIINATSVGMHPDISSSPLPKNVISSRHIVYDIIYNPLETALLKYAKEKGADTINGLEMLLYQAVAQFELYTGRKAPIEAMRKVLLDH